MRNLPDGVTFEVTLWLTSDKRADVHTFTEPRLYKHLDEEALKRWRKKALKEARKYLNDKFGVDDYRLMTTTEVRDHFKDQEH